MDMETAPSLTGYRITKEIYRSLRTVVYQGIRQSDQKSVILKKLRKEYPSFGELIQFRNQYTITKNLINPGIVHSLSLESWHYGYVLVMEDFGGISLRDYTTTNTLSLSEKLAIAIQLADILHYLAQHRIVHKDIKPANILIYHLSKQVKLTDFSIASVLPKETQELKNPHVLEGTLAYLAPEQTGRMNRGIDYRTDFYGLGVTFYEFLSGELPFQSDDPLQLIHCHIAKHPIPPHEINPNIPSMVSAIILKLMAKNAEERYHSALGIKHDLEKCLNQYQETETISEFTLAEKDISDRFLIPEKLYGREKEVQSLLNSFERVARGSSEIMLVAGFSGIGKTAVVNEVHKPITRQQGYFIKGKFDQFNRNIPFSAFVQAFRSLIGQLLGDKEVSLAKWKEKILNAVGENGQVIIDVIPELESIIGIQPPVAELSGNAAQNRFNLLFGKFIQVFTTKEHPLVIFLDDLQWADSTSLNLLKLLTNESESSYLLVLGAYRDNEVFPSHSLMLTLEEINQQEANAHTLNLAPLDEQDVTNLIADTLLCSTKIAIPLSNLVYQNTKGNPFFTTQFLQGLYKDNCIQFNQQVGHWQCDLAQVKQLAITDDVVEFMVGRLQKLPQAAQEALKLAACIGNRFNLATLGVVCEKSQEEVAKDLWQGLQEGFILPESENYKFFQGDNHQDKKCAEVTVSYRFLHDRVQQAAYQLITEDYRQVTHLKIGQKLMSNLSPQEQEEKIFEIVNHFNFGVALISDSTEKEKLVNLNLIAGKKAKASTAYTAAVKYFSVGKSLLGIQGWQIAYDLTLELYQEFAEAAYLSTDFELAEELTVVGLQNAKTILDQVDIYVTKIQSKIAQVKLLEAIQISVKVLKLIDKNINLPEIPTPSDFEKNFHKVQVNLTNLTPTDLLSLPQMKDSHQLAVMRILSSVAPPAYIYFPTLLPLIAMKMVNTSIKFGNTSSSAFGYAMYGFILCGVVNNIELGYQFGQLALNLMEEFNATDIKSKILLLAGHFINPWRNSIRKSLNLLPQAYQAGLESGDLEFASYSASFYCFNSIFVGKELNKLEKEVAIYSDATNQLKQEHVLHQIYLSQQMILNLLFNSEYPWELVGKVYNETEMIPIHKQANNRTTLAFLYVAKLNLCYLFENYPQAQENAALAEEYLDGAVAMLCIVLFYFYDSLVKLTQYLSSTEKNLILEQVANNQTKMKYWADNAPMNYQHKFNLVAAEKCRVLGKFSEAIELYDKAIWGAKDNEYLQEEALANELAAKFYLEWGKEKIATAYMEEAYYCYSRWGAKAKVTHLENNYPQLLKAILQPPVNLTIPSQTGVTSTIGNHNTWLDFPAVIKAAQTISEEIELDRLLVILMKIVVANSGAQTAYLILPQTEQYFVVAQAKQEQVKISEIPLEKWENIPHSLIYYVARTKETAVFANFSNAEQFANDPYLITYQPQSVLCKPILRQGKLLGILYLENNLIEGAFSRDRLEIIQLLTSQAAISLENANLYQKVAHYSHTLEVEVRHKTQALKQKALDLEKTLKQLKQAQAQSIHNGKMLSLGRFVAGIAHEINNPASFIKGNLIHTESYLKEMISLLKIYQQEYPQPTMLIKEKCEDIDTDFLFKDATDLITSMKIGSDRISQVVRSLRDFSRLDESELKNVDLHAGINSTLLILQHRLQALENQPEIAVVKNYGNLPKIMCSARQLNQVFLHIIDNAIDAIWDNPHRSDKPEIRIITEVVNREWVRIVIANTDSVIPKSLQKRIFDPFFTTKSIGAGTGLGLFVSHSIIQSHGGTLSVYSKPREGTKFEILIPTIKANSLKTKN